MKILTWNVERIKKFKNQNLANVINSYDADILVLTETSSKLDFSEKYKNSSTEKLVPNHDGVNYESEENRTTIWTKYEIVKEHKTFDNFTSICTEIKTEFGILNVYATIIGIFGGKGERFKSDLSGQLEDFKNFEVKNFNCIVGDLNVFFSGYAYPSHQARNLLNETFQNLKMKNLTSEIENNVDHIVLSEKFLANRKIEIQTWNLDKKLSDHIGICITIN
ncbi:endonuclease/exonuclease/phosphatase family protein [Flavobacterium sp.]|uniref:endonuclease/exonuclease/phosphatase family protein n=1 Tax=Flavobacterium sp. TaxID=239 RepID=UPI00375008C0